MWLRLDGTPYYAGKGKGKRGLTTCSHRVPCPKDPERIILQEWPSDEVAIEAEKFLIAVYGRKDNGTGCLRNLTDGGEGASGCILSAETRRKVSEAMKGKRGRYWPRRSNIAYKHSPETRRKISEAHKGHRPSLETRQKLGIASRGNRRALGYRHSAEALRKIGEASRRRQSISVEV